MKLKTSRSNHIHQGKSVQINSKSKAVMIFTLGQVPLEVGSEQISVREHQGGPWDQHLRAVKEASRESNIQSEQA